MAGLSDCCVVGSRFLVVRLFTEPVKTRLVETPALVLAGLVDTFCPATKNWHGVLSADECTMDFQQARKYYPEYIERAQELCRELGQCWGRAEKGLTAGRHNKALQASAPAGSSFQLFTNAQMSCQLQASCPQGRTA